MKLAAYRRYPFLMPVWFARSRIHTKRKYRYQVVKARRKMAKVSRRLNYGR